MSDRFQVTVKSEDFGRSKFILVYDNVAKVYISGTFTVSEVLNPSSVPTQQMAFMGYSPALLDGEDMFASIVEALAEDRQANAGRPLELDEGDRRDR